MKCAICKNGDTKEGMTTITFDRDGMILVVKDVPAQICTNVARIMWMSMSPMKSSPSQNAWLKAGHR